MKVFLGPYPNRWRSNIRNRWFDYRYKQAWWNMEDTEFTKFDNFVDGIENVLQFIYNKTINKVLDKRERKVKIKLHNYDTWSADHTIALLVHPLLVQLKERNHGFGTVDDKDVPKELRRTSAPPVEEWQTDANGEKRWDYVMNEMIWAFNAIIHQDDDENSFITFKEDPSAQFGLKITKNDAKARKAHNDRIDNGLLLFGKYFRSLWD